eukprot:GEMP01121524.1.p1 GENE.GEMP01121524.1~~GEMP01121524.1.p1  ORF type:complete len:103 (+),score=11.26 GEMP01121524.1:207-515(+)
MAEMGQTVFGIWIPGACVTVLSIFLLNTAKQKTGLTPRARSPRKDAKEPREKDACTVVMVNNCPITEEANRASRAPSTQRNRAGPMAGGTDESNFDGIIPIV